VTALKYIRVMCCSVLQCLAVCLHITSYACVWQDAHNVTALKYQADALVSLERAEKVFCLHMSTSLCVCHISVHV